ncbi:hypothetical protein VTJ49DRAFT_3024 [Mycothermus thermophilus]|uniref:Uncharacterized protein n=1 Tax=Humicola insolens TaxID=85995 RepID=A0ABR3V8H0_HUMIN
MIALLPDSMAAKRSSQTIQPSMTPRYTMPHFVTYGDWDYDALPYDKHWATTHILEPLYEPQPHEMFATAHQPLPTPPSSASPTRASFDHVPREEEASTDPDLDESLVRRILNRSSKTPSSSQEPQPPARPTSKPPTWSQGTILFRPSPPPSPSPTPRGFRKEDPDRDWDRDWWDDHPATINTSRPDVVDALDETGAALYHHEGPFDAALRARNSSPDPRRNPLDALRDSNSEAPPGCVLDAIYRGVPLPGTPGGRDFVGRRGEDEEVVCGGWKRWSYLPYQADDLDRKDLDVFSHPPGRNSDGSRGGGATHRRSVSDGVLLGKRLAQSLRKRWDISLGKKR